jgi:hypothetical protein
MVTAGEEAVWLEEYEEEEAVSFPAMTKYTIDEKTTVLYDGGGIAIPAKTTVDIELPAKEEDTDSGSDSITLKAGEETYVLQKAKDVIVDTSEQPYLVSTKAITLPISLAKEEDEKLDYTLQRLVRNENDDHLVWQKVPDGVIQINKTDSGAMQLAAENARAGTYQIWIPGYQAAIPFFVQYENASQGGSGQ